MAFASVGEDSRRQSMKPLASKNIVGAAQGQKPAGKRPRQPASQPVDADDLRRRLYIVVSQREAAKERRRQSRMEETIKKPSAEAEVLKAANNRTEGNEAMESAVPAQISTLTTSLYPVDNKNPERTSSSSRNPTSKTALATNNKDITPRRMSEPYIPQEAASQFARTATAHAVPTDKSKIHELSHEALRLHTENSNAAAGTQTRPLRKVQSERERLRDRHQIHSARIPEEGGEASGGDFPSPAERRLKQRYTVPNYEARRRSSATGLAWQSEEQRQGTIWMVEEQADEFARLDPQALQLRLNSGTVDWTQSDENGGDEEDDKKKKSKAQQRSGVRSPLLRKVDSLLGLSQKSGKIPCSSSDGNDAPATTSPPAITVTTTDMVVEKVEAMVPKPVKKGFWTKIRRHVAAVHV